MRRTGTDDMKIQLKVNIPANCLVAKYQLRILSMRNRVIYKHDNPLHILFNPWSEGRIINLYQAQYQDILLSILRRCLLVRKTMRTETKKTSGRRSRSEVFCKKSFLKNFTKFSGKHLCQSLFFNKVADLRRETWLKIDSDTGVFLLICEIFKNTGFKERLQWLLRIREFPRVMGNIQVKLGEIESYIRIYRQSAHFQYFATKSNESNCKKFKSCIISPYLPGLAYPKSY